MVLASTRQREQLARHHTWGEVGISVLGVPKLPCTSTAERCQMERGRRGKSPPAVASPGRYFGQAFNN